MLLFVGLQRLALKAGERSIERVDQCSHHHHKRQGTAQQGLPPLPEAIEYFGDLDQYMP
jgi:hypothetical protein